MQALQQQRNMQVRSALVQQRGARFVFMVGKLLICSFK
jgi:hypothetical protein